MLDHTALHFLVLYCTVLYIDLCNCTVHYNPELDSPKEDRTGDDSNNDNNNNNNDNNNQQ